MALFVVPRYLGAAVPKQRCHLTPSEIAVRSALRRRGLAWDGERDPTPLFVPRGRARDRHYTLLGHYSYRLFLRDVLKYRNDLRLSLLTRYAGPQVAAQYLRFLTRTRLVKAAGHGKYRLGISGVTSFGQTLEWYVAELLVREFGSAATFGVRVPQARHGGDYDVLACAEGELIYVETKSAPPRQIIQGEVRAFLERVDTLRPTLALFLVDTQLRMRDKLLPFFRAEIRRRSLKCRATRLEREIWQIGPAIYLLNGSPDLTRNLRVCLAAHFRARGIALGCLPPTIRAPSDSRH